MIELVAMTSEGITRGVFSNFDLAKAAAAKMLNVAPDALEWQQDADQEDCIFATNKATDEEVYLETFELDRVYYVDEDNEDQTTV